MDNEFLLFYLVHVNHMCGHAWAQDGRTPLMWAAKYGHADCMRLLLEAGADKEATGKVRARVVSPPRLRSVSPSVTSDDVVCGLFSLRYFRHTSFVGADESFARILLFFFSTDPR